MAPIFPSWPNKEIRSIVKKELGPEIAAEIQEYRENNELGIKALPFQVHFKMSMETENPTSSCE